MEQLPRGRGYGVGARTATADWATEPEILRFRWSEGDLWFGKAQVLPESFSQLSESAATFQNTLEADILLDPEWRLNRIAQVHDHLGQIRTLNLVDIGVSDDRHIVTVAGSRSGKGTSAIIPNLCLYPGSVIVIDPKGENASRTAARRGKGSKFCDGLGQQVYVLDPFNVADVDDGLRASFNPLDRIDVGHDDAVDQASTIAEAIVVRGGGDDSAHFDESARQFIKGLILHVLTDEDLSGDLLTVRHLLSHGDDGPNFDAALKANLKDNPDFEIDSGGAFLFLLEQMLDNPSFDGAVSGAARVLLDMGERERGSVLSTARRNTEFLDSPAMKRCLQETTVELDDLKSDANGISIFLCLPAERMSSHGRWLRLLVSLALESTYKSQSKPASGHSVLFLLEEFAALGHLEVIERAAGYAAGFGVKLWAILQDLPQLQKHYRQSWETFLGNAGIVQVFGNSDLTTLEYMAKRLGETEVTQNIESLSTSMSIGTNDPSTFQRASSLLMQGGAIGVMTTPFLALLGQTSKGQNSSSTSSLNQSIQKTALLSSDEIERYFSREQERQLVFVKGKPPFPIPRVAYHNDTEFLGLYDPDKDHVDEPLLRDDALARRNEKRAQRRDLIENQAQQLADLINESLETARLAKRNAKVKRVLRRVGFWSLAIFAALFLLYWIAA